MVIRMTDRIMTFQSNVDNFYFSPLGLFHSSLLYFSHKKDSIMLAHCDDEKAAQGGTVQRQLLSSPSTKAGLEVLVKKCVASQPTRVYLSLQTHAQGALRPCRTIFTSHG